MTKEETGERMARLETDVKYIKEQLDSFIKTADDKYASKDTEKIVYGLVAIIIIAVIGAMIGKVVIP